MPRPASLRPPLPAALLLGLLALLLWGECGWSRGGKVAPALYANVAYVGRLSVAAGQPTTLPLALKLDNSLGQPCRLGGAWGEVSFEGRHWPVEAPGRVRNRVLAAGDTLIVPVVVTVVLATDSLASLRAMLQEGSTGGNSLRLALNVPYFAADAPQVARLAQSAVYLPGQPASRP